MSEVRSYTVELCERSEIRDFVEEWHYSHSINGVTSDHCFKLIKDGNIIGAAIFGKMAMPNQWKRFVDSPEKAIELRRLCCIDDTPKNAESYFIGKCLKWLKQNTGLEVIVSYADQTYGHDGTIYKATNFEHTGMTPKGKMIRWGDRLYHDKDLRTKYKGRLKPYSQRLRDALEAGEATWITTQGKHRYVYRLRGRGKR